MKKDKNYFYKDVKGVTVSGKTQSIFIDIEVIKTALSITNRKIDILNENAPELFEILGMRNLSAFVGEVFVRSLVEASNGILMKNPHQDGYPDLLIMTDEGSALWDTLKVNNQAKSPFSGFETGGIEVKATCGSVPDPKFFIKQGIRKPDIGDERIAFTRGYDWKAHHRETTNLIGLYWDFIDRKPIICAVFFGDNLNENDWGKIVQPKEGGGRTTSVSIMTREGIFKMYQNWLAVIDDKRYVDFLDKFNRSNLIADFLAR